MKQGADENDKTDITRGWRLRAFRLHNTDSPGHFFRAERRRRNEMKKKRNGIKMHFHREDSSDSGLKVSNGFGDEEWSVEG